MHDREAKRRMTNTLLKQAADALQLSDAAVHNNDLVRKLEWARGTGKRVEMAEVLVLTQTDFDYLENNHDSAIHRKELGIFIDSKEQTAWSKVENYLSSMQHIRPYLAWDGEVYPKFKVTKKLVR